MYFSLQQIYMRQKNAPFNTDNNNIVSTTIDRIGYMKQYQPHLNMPVIMNNYRY